VKTPEILGLCALLALAFGGCATSTPAVEPEPEMLIGMPNPWVWVETLAEAETRAGFKLGVPEVVDGRCRAIRFGVLTGKTPMLEAVYRFNEAEITIRKEVGEGKNISGVYGFDRRTTFVRSGVTVTCARPTESAPNPNAWVLTFSSNGYSYSLYATTSTPQPLLDALLTPLLP